jgi:hypothetical protein
MGDWVLLAYDVALKVHAYFDGLARLRGCTAPDAIAVFFEPGDAGEAIRLDPGFRLTFGEAVSPGNRSTRIRRAVRSVHCRRVCIAARGREKAGEIVIRGLRFRWCRRINDLRAVVVAATSMRLPGEADMKWQLIQII